jgi:hypothetical protein
MRGREFPQVADPSTSWLTLTNIVLGLVTLICCGAFVIGVLQELATGRRKKAALSKLDREVADLVASYDNHVFNVPGLGATMTDGGNEPRAKERR